MGDATLAEGLVVLALGLLGVGVWGVARWIGGRRHGHLVYVDDRDGDGGLVSHRYHLVGRPDEIRRLPDGRPIPVEWKSRPSPSHEIPFSHQVQLWAYCLLLEDVTGFRPPFGVLRYSDGGEFRLPWDEPSRRRLLALRRDMERAYDGAADPSPAKCARCPWRPGCDARAPLPSASDRWVR